MFLSPRQKPIWVPQEGSQTLFMASSSVFEVLYEGERGPGKTDALLMSFAQFVDQGFGDYWQGIIFRKTFPELKDIISKSHRWFPQIFPNAKYHSTEHCWEFQNGEKLRFAHMRVPEDYMKYHGHEYPFVAFEELTTWADDVCYRRMMSCCRSSCPNPKMPRMYRSTTNPYGPGHTWVKDRFKLPESRFEIIQDELGAIDAITGKVAVSKPRLAINGSLLENKILLESDPNYLATLKESARNEQELNAWIKGSWDIVSGGMFSDVFIPSIHVIPKFTIPKSWKIDRVFDWGSSRPFSLGWYAESNGEPYIDPITGRYFGEVKGDVFRIGEWYGSTGKPNEGLRLEPTDFAIQAAEREMRMGIHNRCRPGPADISIFATDHGPSTHSIYNRQNIRFVKAAKGPFSRIRGWEVCRDYFKNAIPPIDGSGRTLPGVFIFENCKEFKKFIPAMSRSDTDPDDIDPDIEDHIADEFRYRLCGEKSSVKVMQF